MGKNHDDINDLIAAKTGGLVTEDDFDDQDDSVAPTPTKSPVVAPAKAEPPKTPTVLPFSREFETLPDGSLRGVVIISPENSELLRTWAEGAGEPLEEYIQTHLDEALSAYAASTG